ncbi:hypothetical protein M2347_003683 [Chryseobacterium sp. H1D6B]|uniref:hypothetical protein n=1 Tax=Chryseobacterium sp. H1D6B TaxID=2940588 RepID=UPI0015CD3DF3|nr:hypothetical protein [Chryseobacterium sp. H1D6B]MDH6253956.1 hypothetical protein [Chryseobacterium sp. H1D6B]
MKKVFAIGAALLLSNFINAQQWDGSAVSAGYITRTGTVGVGTNLNVDRFNLSGNLRMVDGKITFGYFPPTPHTISSSNSYYDIQYYGNGLYLYPSNAIFTIDPNVPGGVITERRGLFLSNDFRVGMGTDNFSCADCTDYRLFVKDGIRTERVKVDVAANNGWADYVFAKDYKLRPLKELQAYINDNGHLPEVPTTEEAVKNGIELKEMNILLLKKIEELTLYTLQQQENMEKQNKRIEMLEKKLRK